MNLTSDNWRDIDRYYRGCYVKYPELFGDKLFYVSKVTEECIRGTHLDTETGDTEAPYTYSLWPEGHKEGNVRSIKAEFLLPKKSYFMHENSAYILFRKPMRQWKKGISDENTSIQLLQSSGEFSTVGVNWDLVSSYVDKPAFVGFDFSREKLSYALSPRIACCRAGYIYVDRIRIGHFDAGAKQISLKNEMFLEEIKNILATHNQTISITTGKTK